MILPSPAAVATKKLVGGINFSNNFLLLAVWGNRNYSCHLGNPKYNNRDYDSALKVDKVATTWTKVEFFAGLAIGISYFTLMILGFGIAFMGNMHR